MTEWIDYDGNGMPVHPETVVVVRFLFDQENLDMNYENSPAKAKDLRWTWKAYSFGPGKGNIVQYKILEKYNGYFEVSDELLKKADSIWMKTVLLGGSSQQGLRAAIKAFVFDFISNYNDWQPIETAPKGPTILLYGKIDPNTKFEMLTWKNNSVFTGAWDLIDESWIPCGGTWEGPFMEVTHWKHLPEPPKDKIND
jgi:hypothetical protein